MALYDNKYWLLSHIRNSFITTDDTGMCDLIMSGEEGVRKHLKDMLDPYPDEEESEDDLSHESYDLQLDIDFGMRFRSNTAARLEKMEQIKRRTSRIKHVKWEMSKTPISQEYLDEALVRKDPAKKLPETASAGAGASENAPQAKTKNFTSLLTKTLQQYKQMPANPFLQYSKFDGSGHSNVGVKKFRIFLTMLPEPARNYPIQVACTVNAKIQDLIGLILLKCSTNYEEYHWKPVSHYGLYITEEDGEVDRDFPNLDPRENISKFGFTCLGLVENSDPSKLVSFEYAENTDVVEESREQSLDRKAREQSKLGQDKQTSADLHLMDVHNKAMEAPLYKSYRVFLLNKLLTKIEINLGISSEKLEIDPVQQQTSKKFVGSFALAKTKPVSHSMECVAACELSTSTSGITGSGSGGSEHPQHNNASGNVAGGSGKSGSSGSAKNVVFRIIYRPSMENVSSPAATSASNLKSYEMEADYETAKEIVQKISLILELRASPVRKEYLQVQERKQYQRKSFRSK